MNLEPLSVSLKLTSDQFRAGIAGAQQSLAGLKSNLSGAQQSVKNFGKGLTDIGKNLTTKVTLPIVGFGVFAVKAASDLNEAWSAASTVYGKGADVIIDKSKQAAKQVGLSQEQYLSSAATLGVFANSAGLAGKDAAGFSAELITGASDLSSFYNAAGGVPQVLDDIKSGLAGETEPLRKYGILLSQATLEQYAQEQGIWDGVDAMTEQEKVLARQGFILSHLGAAQGDFARTSGGLANKTRILKAQFTDLSAQFGTVLLPIVTDLATKFGKLLERFQALSPEQQKMILIVAGIAAAIGPLLIVVGQLAIGISALIPVFGLLLGPVGLIIAALVLLGIAYKTNFLGFGDAVRAVAKVLKNFIKYIRFVNDEGDILNDWLSHLPKPLQAIAKWAARLMMAFKKMGAGIGAIFKGDFTRGIKMILSGFGDLVATGPKLIGDFLKGITTGFGPLDALLQNAGKVFIDFGRLIQEIFQGDWSGALEVGIRLVRHFGEMILSALDLLWIGVQAFFTKIDWGALLRAGIDKLGDLSAWLLPRGIALIRGLWQGARDFFTGTVWPWLQGLPGEILAAIPVVADLLYEKGKSLLRGLRRGVQDLWDNTLKPWLGDFANKALNAVPSLMETLKDKGKALMYGLHNGIKAIWNAFGGGGGSTVAGWLKELGSKAVDAVGDLIETLKQKGKDLIQGLWDGVKNKWSGPDGLRWYLMGLPGLIVGAIPNPLQILWSTGKAIMDGLYNGIAAGWETVKGLLSSIGDQIPDWKGPLTKDLKLLVPSGQAIMQGFMAGIDSQLPSLSDQLTGITNTMPALVGASGSGGTMTTVNIAPGAIVVNGSSDPKTTAEETFRIFSRELGLRAGL